VLQERVVERLGEARSIRTDIRVIASTNVKLDAVVQRGHFRSDLFFRLNVIPLTLPPLRERLDDLPVLAQYFAQRFAERNGQSLPSIAPSFVQRLATYDWPGNVRELANFMQRVLSMSAATEISAADFDREHRPVRSMGFSSSTPVSDVRQPLSMDQLERTHLERTLELVGGNRTRAAEILGISVRTMRNKIRQYDLPPRRYA
jgi:DNA-binding NtrC family response regulator